MKAVHLIMISLFLTSCGKHFTDPVDIEIINASVNQTLRVGLTDKPPVRIPPNSSVVVNDVQQTTLLVITATAGSEDIPDIPFHLLEPSEVHRIEVSSVVEGRYTKNQESKLRAQTKFILSCNQREIGWGVEHYDFSFYQRNIGGR